MRFSSILKSLILLIFILSAAALAYKNLGGIDYTTIGQIPVHIDPVAERPTTSKALASARKNTVTPSLSNDLPSLQKILTLKAIIPAEGDYDASAYIQYHEGQPDYFYIGSSVFNVAILEGIQNDRVIVSHQGQSVTLLLATDNTGDSALIVENNSTSDTTGLTSNLSIRERAALIAGRLNDPENKIRKTAIIYNQPKFTFREDRQLILDQEREQSLKDLTDEAWAFIQYKPVQLEDEISGITLNGVGEEIRFLNKHGLEAGDIIKRIDGTKLDSQDAITKTIDMLGEGKPVELTIERDGHKEIIIINKK